MHLRFLTLLLSILSLVSLISSLALLSPHSFHPSSLSDDVQALSTSHNSLYPRGLASNSGLYPSPFQSLSLAPGWLTIFSTYRAFKPLGPAGLALGTLYWEVFTAAFGHMIGTAPGADPVG